MVLLDKSDAPLLRSKGFREFLDAGVKEAPDYIMSLFNRRMRYVEAAAMEIYHGLIWFLEEYPEVESVRPIWYPEVENEDRNMLVRFRLRIKLKGESDLGGEYGYDECPQILGEKFGQQAFDRLIEMGELIAPELWNEFLCLAVSSRGEPYSSPEEVKTHLNEDLEAFMAETQQWILEARLAVPQGTATRLRL